MKLKPVEEQVVVIVGANSGIGRKTALDFAQRGAKVVLSGRSQTAVNNAAEEIRRNGGEAVAAAADVTDFEQMQALAERAVETYGRIDTWVHLAAVTLYARFEDTRPEEFRQVLNVNLLGQIHGALAALPHLRRGGGGALIHISSVEARQTLPLQSAYAASKHGMIGFLDALRMELEEEGAPISVTNIKPASINTPLFSKALTRLGVKPRPLPPVYEPDVVSAAILYAAEHPVRDLYAGGAGKALGMLQRISPRAAEKMMRRMGFAGQKSDQPKSADAPNNLFEHLDGYDRVYGDYGAEARSSSMYTGMRRQPLRFGMLASALALGAWVAGRTYVRNKDDINPRIRRAVEGMPARARRVQKMAFTRRRKLSRPRALLARRRRRTRLPNDVRLPEIGRWLQRTAAGLTNSR